jgi:hypothetical protein
MLARLAGRLHQGAKQPVHDLDRLALLIDASA